MMKKIRWWETKFRYFRGLTPIQREKLREFIKEIEDRAYLETGKENTW